MRTRALFVLVPAVVAGIVTLAAAQSSGPAGTVAEGSANTLVNGRPAARVGDTTTGGAVIEGSPNVLINGKPVAVVGSTTGCGGVVMGGAGNVLINGKPVATAGSITTGCQDH